MIRKLEIDYARGVGWEEGFKEGFKKGYKEGLEIGREEARKKIRIEIIPSMVKLGYSYEDINEIFPLTEEKYLELKEDK